MASHPVEKTDDLRIIDIHPLYPIKVWTTALFIVAPVCFWIEDMIVHKNIRINPQDLMIVPLFGLAGSVFSLPVYGILFLAFRYLTKKQLAPVYVKWILNSLCVLGIFITFKIIDENPQFGTALCYSASAIIASLFFKIYSSPFRKVTS
jgi:hypothetical protein